MQARIYLQPLANAAGDYQDEFQIEQDVLPQFKLEQRLNQSKWSTGLIFPGTSNLELANPTGRYDSPSSGTSVFSLAGADKARVRVEYPTYVGGSDHQVIFRGQIEDFSSSWRPGLGESAWKIRTSDVVFLNRKLNAGLITNGMTVAEAIQALFTDLQIAEAIPNLNIDNLYDPNFLGGGTIINDEDRLLGEDRPADQVLQKLLLVGDNLMTYVPYRQEARIMRRAEPPSNREDGTFATGWSSGYITDPLLIETVESGTERIFNQINCTTGVPGTFSTITETNEGSQRRWGRRSLNLDLTWVRDLDQISRIAKNLLKRLSTPQQRIVLTVPSLAPYDGGLWQIYNQDAIVGGLVGLDIPPRTPPGSARFGTASFGEGRFARVSRPGITGIFYIESIERDIGTDLTKISIRRYIDQ